MPRPVARALVPETGPSIQVAHVDGIPTFWAPVPGPLTAGLVFRVGTVDETLAQAGITHLIEHLAMHELSGHRYQANAYVSHRRTVFHCRGSVEEVTGFLSGITAALRSLPLERVTQERKVLATESASRGASLAANLAAMRFGATGVGKSIYREFGLEWLDASHLREWAATYFTAENAVLWLSGPVPKNLSLQLPHGTRRAEPTLRRAALPTPSWFTGVDGAVGFSLVGKRSVELATACAVLDRRLMERIRHDLALSYTSTCTWQPLTSTDMHIVAMADGLHDNFPEIGRAMLDVVDRLAGDGPTRRELADVRRDVERAAQEPSKVLALLATAADSELMDDDWLDAGEQIEAVAATTPSSVSRALTACRDTMLLSVPAGIYPPETLAQAPLWSETRARGRAFKPIRVQGEDRSSTRSLVVGADGMTIEWPAGPVTTSFSQAAVLLRYTDGGRTLIDVEGFRISVLPGEWKDGEAAVEAIDQAVPSELHVPMPAEAKCASAAVPRQPADPVKGARLRRIGWWAWLAVSLLAACAIFTSPTADGKNECGRATSLGVVLGGAQPVKGKRAAVVRQQCVNDARDILLGSGIGLASAGVAVVARFRKRRS